MRYVFFLSKEITIFAKNFVAKFFATSNILKIKEIYNEQY